MQFLTTLYNYLNLIIFNIVEGMEYIYSLVLPEMIITFITTFTIQFIIVIFLSLSIFGEPVKELLKNRTLYYYAFMISVMTIFLTNDLDIGLIEKDQISNMTIFLITIAANVYGLLSIRNRIFITEIGVRRGRRD